MDESTQTCDERFAMVGRPQTVDARRAYRELIVTTPGPSHSISGVILYDETIRQQNREGIPFVEVPTDAGITPEAMVDSSTRDMDAQPGETVTQALDGLCADLRECSALGARWGEYTASMEST
jgi:fructose-bisphosphate aldolase class I